MTAEELKETIRQRKIAAFDYAMHLSRMDERQLAASGYRGMPSDQAMAKHIERVAEFIEKDIRKYEKENP